jgi:hypothetical protein
MRMQSVQCPCCHHDSGVLTLRIQATDGLHIAECAYCGAEFVVAGDELQAVDMAERHLSGRFSRSQFCIQPSSPGPFSLMEKGENAAFLTPRPEGEGLG